MGCCRRESILGIARSRTGWLVAFCIGLLLAAVVVEQFEDILEHHVSFKSVGGRSYVNKGSAVAARQRMEARRNRVCQSQLVDPADGI